MQHADDAATVAELREAGEDPRARGRPAAAAAAERQLRSGGRGEGVC